MKFKSALFVLLTMFIFSGCGEDDENPYTCSSCVDEPEARDVNDESGKGIYKGVIIGSTGTIKINMDNAGDGEINAVLVIDKKEIILTTSESYGEDGFQGCFINEDENVSICFYVSANGSFEFSEIEIPGHSDVTISLFKELSSALVMAFEGSYSGDASGTWNMVMRLMENGNGSWYAISKGNDDEDEVQYSSGEITTENGIMGGGGGVTITGTMDGDIIKGTWASNGSASRGTSAESSGTWKGKRTL